jgi:hypothetical protein
VMGCVLSQAKQEIEGNQAHVGYCHFSCTLGKGGSIVKVINDLYWYCQLGLCWWICSSVTL